MAPRGCDWISRLESGVGKSDIAPYRPTMLYSGPFGVTPANILILNARVVYAFQSALRSAKLPDPALLPHLFPHEQAVKRACELFGTSKTGLAFATTLRKVLTDAGITGLQPKGTGDGETWLVKPINSDLALRIGVDRNREFFGFGFNLLIGVEVLSGPAARLRWCDRFLAFAGEGFFSRSFWVFANKAELEECFAEAAHLLLAVLPALEAALVRYVEPAAQVLHPDIPVRVGLTARQAFDLVLPEARKWQSDASLRRIDSSSICHRRGPRTGLDLDMCGRLAPPGAWQLQFWSANHPSKLNFELPAWGMLTSSIDVETVNSRKHQSDLDVPPDFMDSDRAMSALSPYLGGAELLRAADYLSLRLQVDYFRGQIGSPCWQGRRINDQGDRAFAMVHAINGLPVEPLAPKG